MFDGDDRNCVRSHCNRHMNGVTEGRHGILDHVSFPSPNDGKCASIDYKAIFQLLLATVAIAFNLHRMESISIRRIYPSTAIGLISFSVCSFNVLPRRDRWVESEWNETEEKKNFFFVHERYNLHTKLCLCMQSADIWFVTANSHTLVRIHTFAGQLRNLRNLFIYDDEWMRTTGVEIVCAIAVTMCGLRVDVSAVDCVSCKV